MANTRPRIYTVRIAVPITGGHREALRQYAAEQELGMGVVMREALLEQARLKRLSRLSESNTPIGDQLNRTPSTRLRKRHGARVVVNLTVEQSEALEDYARRKKRTLSSLLRDAGLERCGLKSAPALTRGRPLGSRTQSSPPPLPRKTPGNASKRKAGARKRR